MAIAEEKQALRRELRRQIRELPETYRTRSDRETAARLLSLDAFRRAGTVCCFVGTGREIDTRPVLEAALSGGKRLCVPLCLSPGRMEMRRILSLNDLTPGFMGIPEPDPAAETVEPEEIDLLVVPCLSCDRRGVRLGQGGGYYDRFLRRCPGTAVLLCRERLLLPRVPEEPHDIPVPFVLTERGTYRDGVFTETPAAFSMTGPETPEAAD